MGGRSWGWFVLLACGASCIPSGPNDVTETVAQVGVSNDTLDSEQSEVALVWSRAFLAQVLIAGFNDDSWSNDASAPREWDFSANPPVVRRGASLMGRSTSVDLGTTWEYRGKIYPPPGWSLLYGDPSLAVDPANPNIVYYANLAFDKAHWDSMNNGLDTIPLLPQADGTGFDPLRTNGVCVAQSLDSGVTFGTPVCIPFDLAAPANVGTTDRTVVTVGGDGRVYLGSIDTFANSIKHFIRIFRTTVPGDISTFEETSPPAQFSGTVTPRLRTDFNGDVWLGSLDTPTMLGVGRGVLIARYTTASAAWTDVVEANTICSVPKVDQDAAVFIGNQFLRNGREYDFDVGKDENNNAMVGVVFQLRRSPLDQRRYLQGARIRSDLVTCDAPPFTNLLAPPFHTYTDPGDQFQPSISYQPRLTPTSLGSVPDNEWWMAYYTTRYSPDPTMTYVEAEARRMEMSLQQLQVIPEGLTPPGWFACPNGSYWGDYFDLSPIRDDNGNWWSVAAFTSSLGAPPCTSQGEPMGIAATRW